MLGVGMRGEEVNVAVLIAGDRVSAQVAVELTQLGNDVEVGVEDGQVAGAAADVDILGVGINAGGLAKIALCVEQQVAVCIKDVNSILFAVADPNVILGINCQRMRNQELTRSVNIIKEMVVAIAAPSLDKVVVLIKLMHSTVAVAIGDVHVALAVVINIGGVMERLAKGHSSTLLIPFKRTAATLFVQGLGGNNTLVHTPVGQSVLVHIVLRALMERCQCGFGLAGFQIKTDKAAATYIGE